MTWSAWISSGGVWSSGRARIAARFDLNDEAAIDARDERVRTTLREAIAYKRDLARQLREEARELETGAARIEQAVKNGEWWKLEGLLERADVESLCECELADRNEYLSPNADDGRIA